MTFEARWRMSLDDFRVLTKAHKRRKRSETYIRLADPIVMLLSGLGSVYFFWTGDVGLGSLCAGYVIVLIVIRQILEPWILRRRFKMQNLDESELQMRADANGVTVTSDHADTVLKWSGINKVDRLDGRTVLWMKGIVGIAVPDHAFADADVAGEFLEFAREKTNG